jgi:hypothetical protein
MVAPRALLLLALGFVVPTCVAAQTVVDQIRSLSGENAELYAEPLARGLAQALAGGHMERASVLPALGFDLGVRVMGARPTREARTFQPVIPDSVVFQHPFTGQPQVYFDPFRAQDGATESPTIVGEGAGIVLVPDGDFEAALLEAGQDPADYRIAFPSGQSISVVPTMSFHGSLGIGMGTEVTMHFLPTVEILSEVGEVRSHGLSVSHSPTHWFSSPVDLLLTAGYHEGRAGEEVHVSALHYGGVGGVAAGPMSFFGGVQLRYASTDVNYRIENPDGVPGIPADGLEVSFSTDAGSGPSYLVGARLQLLVLNIAGHYSVGSYDVFSIKMGLGLP